MGKSIRSKRMRRNRNVKRTFYGPKEKEALKAALAFEYNEQTEKAHLSMFHETMNGPPPAVPGLEPGSKLERAHLTEGHVSVDRIDNFMVGKMKRLITSATRALTKGVKSRPHYKEALKNEEEKEAVENEEEKMDDTQLRIYDKKTMKDQFGQYPVWMNKKKIQSKARADRIEKRKAKRAAKRKSGRVAAKPLDVEMKEKENSDSSDESDVNMY